MSLRNSSITLRVWGIIDNRKWVDNCRRVDLIDRPLVEESGEKSATRSPRGREDHRKQNLGAVHHVTRLYEAGVIDAINLSVHVTFLGELLLNNGTRPMNINKLFVGT